MRLKWILTIVLCLVCGASGYIQKGKLIASSSSVQMIHQISIDPFNSSQALIAGFKGISLFQIYPKMKQLDILKVQAWSSGVTFFPNKQGLGVGCDYQQKKIALLKIGKQSLVKVGDWFQVQSLIQNIDISQEANNLVVFSWDKFHLLKIDMENSQFSLIQSINLPSGVDQVYGKFLTEDHIILVMQGEYFGQNGFHSYIRQPLVGNYEYAYYHKNIQNQKIASFDFLHFRQRVVYVDQITAMLKIAEFDSENNLVPQDLEIDFFGQKDQIFNQYQYISISTPKDYSYVLVSTENTLYQLEIFVDEFQINYWKALSILLVFGTLIIIFSYLINKYHYYSTIPKQYTHSLERINLESP